MGETVRLDCASSIPIRAKVVGRSDFKRIELIQNGTVVAKAASRKVGGHFEAELSTQLSINNPCWLALRTPSPPVKDDPELKELPSACNKLRRPAVRSGIRANRPRGTAWWTPPYVFPPIARLWGFFFHLSGSVPSSIIIGREIAGIPGGR